MRSKRLIILVFFFFPVSSQAGSHGIHSTFIGDSNSTDKFTQIKMLSQEQSSLVLLMFMAIIPQPQCLHRPKALITLQMASARTTHLSMKA